LVKWRVQYHHDNEISHVFFLPAYRGLFQILSENLKKNVLNYVPELTEDLSYCYRVISCSVALNLNWKSISAYKSCPGLFRTMLEI